jgi:hypothetical protein
MLSGVFKIAPFIQRQRSGTLATFFVGAQHFTQSPREQFGDRHRATTKAQKRTLGRAQSPTLIGRPTKESCMGANVEVGKDRFEVIGNQTQRHHVALQSSGNRLSFAWHHRHLDH